MASSPHLSNESVEADHRRQGRLRATLALIAAVWSASDLGYYLGYRPSDCGPATAGRMGRIVGNVVGLALFAMMAWVVLRGVV